MVTHCPVCHQSINPVRFLLRLSSSRCQACGSLLIMDKKRRWLGGIPYTILLLGITLVLTRAGYSDYIAIPVGLILWLPCFLVFDRAVVLERRGFRCKQCGYDLRGQEVPQCPECGRELDPDQVQQMKLPDPSAVVERAPGRRGRWWLLTIPAIVVLLVGLICGIWRYLQSAPPGARP